MTRTELIKIMQENLRTLHHREHGEPMTNPDGIEIVGFEDAADEIMTILPSGIKQPEQGDILDADWFKKAWFLNVHEPPKLKGQSDG